MIDEIPQTPSSSSSSSAISILISISDAVSVSVSISSSAILTVEPALSANERSQFNSVQFYSSFHSIQFNSQVSQLHLVPQLGQCSAAAAQLIIIIAAAIPGCCDVFLENYFTCAGELTVASREHLRTVFGSSAQLKLLAVCCWLLAGRKPNQPACCSGEAKVSFFLSSPLLFSNLSPCQAYLPPPLLLGNYLLVPPQAFKLSLSLCLFLRSLAHSISNLIFELVQLPSSFSLNPSASANFNLLA